jgi:adenosylcobyric acid synthase
MSARALMILGTASHAGKSLMTAALGRIFSNEGIRVAPFKAQNMSLNSAATPDGLEIGRAQALQAEACRVTPCADMNPILIKPCSDTGSQVVVLGRVWGQVTAWDYHERRVEELFPIVVESYRKLAARHELVLLEGAGSPAEINLREHDIVNLRMARAADAACVLVGDIDRGGVFASLLGTVELLDQKDRRRIRGFVINKFRGDRTLLQPGIAAMEQRLGIPCVGVIPFLQSLQLDEEDSVALQDFPRAGAWERRGPCERADRPLRVAVIAMPHLANFTDFDALAQEPSVSLALVERPEGAAGADVLVLPGSKQTLDDLAWLRASGFAETILAHGGPIIGICAGLQMLGVSIDDPCGVENGGISRAAAGLGLLPVRTVMSTEKTVRQVHGPGLRGYEIHMGETLSEEDVRNGGIFGCDRVWGTYVHGLFDDDHFRHAFLQRTRQARGLTPAPELRPIAGEREARINRWADHVRQSLDLDVIRGWIWSAA